MIDYKVCLNNGNEVLGVDQKTITANEDVRTADEAAIAREIHHENALIPEQVAQSVLQNFCKAAANLMSMGFSIQLKNGNDVALRIHPDIHVDGGNIDLARAKELMPDDVHTEEDMVTYAGELVSRAGVTLKVKAESQPKFTELLKSLNPGVNRTGIVERAKVTRKDGEGGETPDTGGTGSISTGDQGDQDGTQTGDDSGTSTGSDTGGQQGSYRLVIYKYGSGTMTVTDGNGQVINSNDNVASGSTVNISVVPVAGKVPTAQINGTNIPLTENNGTYTGSFQMPTRGTSLEINSDPSGFDED